MNGRGLPLRQSDITRSKDCRCALADHLPQERQGEWQRGCWIRMAARISTVSIRPYAGTYEPLQTCSVRRPESASPLRAGSSCRPRRAASPGAWSKRLPNAAPPTETAGNLTETPVAGSDAHCADPCALKHSIAPIEQAFGRLWPEARVWPTCWTNSLSTDLARDGALTPAMTERFLTCARYAASCGADGILFTCSAFGPCIEACARTCADAGAEAERGDDRGGGGGPVPPDGSGCLRHSHRRSRPCRRSSPPWHRG